LPEEPVEDDEGKNFAAWIEERIVKAQGLEKFLMTFEKK
jgi:hypothetical protein